MSIVRPNFELALPSWKRLLLFCHYLNYEHSSNDVCDTACKKIFTFLYDELCNTVGVIMQDEIFERKSDNGLKNLELFCKQIIDEMSLVEQKHFSFIDIDAWNNIKNEFQNAQDIFETATRAIFTSKNVCPEYISHSIFPDGIIKVWEKQENDWQCFEPIIGDRYFSSLEYFLMIIGDEEHQPLSSKFLYESNPIDDSKLLLYPILGKKISIAAFVMSLLYCVNDKDESLDMLGKIKDAVCWKNYTQVSPADWIDKFRFEQNLPDIQTDNDISIKNVLSKYLGRPTFSEALANHNLDKALSEEQYSIPTLWNTLAENTEDEVPPEQLISYINKEIRYFRAIQLPFSQSFVDKEGENKIRNSLNNILETLSELDNWFDYALSNIERDDIVKTNKVILPDHAVYYENEGSFEKLYDWVRYKPMYLDIREKKAINNIVISQLVDRYIEQDCKAKDIVNDFIEYREYTSSKTNPIIPDNKSEEGSNINPVIDKFINDHSNLFSGKVFIGSGAQLAKSLIEDDIVESKKGWKEEIFELLADVEMDGVFFNGTELILPPEIELPSILNKSRHSVGQFTERIQWNKVDKVFIKPDGYKLSSGDIKKFFVHNLDKRNKNRLLINLIRRYYPPIRDEKK